MSLTLRNIVASSFKIKQLNWLIFFPPFTSYRAYCGGTPVFCCSRQPRLSECQCWKDLKGPVFSLEISVAQGPKKCLFPDLSCLCTRCPNANLPSTEHAKCHSSLSTKHSTSTEIWKMHFQVLWGLLKAQKRIRADVNYLLAYRA